MKNFLIYAIVTAAIFYLICCFICATFTPVQMDQGCKITFSIVWASALCAYKITEV